MHQHFEVTAVSAEAEELKRVAAKYGVAEHCIEMTREITPFKDARSLWKMYRLLRREKPEIVHTHTPKAGLIGMTAAFFAGVPVRMHTVAGLPLLETSGMKRRILNTAERLTSRFATGAYPNSFALRDIMRKHGLCPKNKLFVIANGSSNGIDTSYFSPAAITLESKKKLREELNISEEDFVFIFVGRLVKDKGLNELISAFAALLRDNPNGERPSHRLRLLLVGSFEQALNPVAAETLREIETNLHILTVGFQDDVRPYLAISNALVFPSYREGFPNVVLQAGAMGIPAIVSDINGCNEIVEHGKNGLIVQPKDETALYHAMLQLTSEPVMLRAFAENSRSIICEKYEQQKVWEALLAEYHRLLK